MKILTQEFKALLIGAKSKPSFTYNAPDELYDQFAEDAADIIDSFDADLFARIPESSGPLEEAAENESLNETPNLMEENTSVVQ